MGAWRYSMALVIVLAAMLDVMWWVPMSQRAARERELRRDDAPAVQATIPRCRAAQLQQQIDRLQAELDATLAEIERIEK